MRISVSIWLLALGLLVLAASQPALATAQFPDVLIYEGKEHSLFSNPLESYYGPDRPRPPFKMWHTANYRGYVATWEIDKGMLYLKKIKARLDGKEVGLDYLFPGNNGRVAATWFTGKLRVPQGKQLQYVHAGYRSVYEQELILTLKDGKVTDKEVIDNRDKVKKDKKEK